MTDEPSLIVPTTRCVHSRYEDVSFRDIVEEARALLQKHLCFDSKRLITRSRGERTMYYWGPELPKETWQKTLPDDNRAINALHEYVLEAYRDIQLPSEGNPLSFLAKGFRQYFKVDYWNGRNFTMSYNFKGEFLDFTFGVRTESDILYDPWKKEMISDEEFMRLTHKYFSPEHFYRGTRDANHHAQHSTSLRYVIECFLGRER